MERETHRQKTEKEQLEKMSKKVVGEDVPLVSTVSIGHETSEIYLKHACNESSEDEDGTENKDENEDEEKKEESFKSFLERHKIEQIKRKNQESEPSTSKKSDNVDYI